MSAADTRAAMGTGAVAGAACAACCAPPLIAALGLTLGLAAVAGLIAGIAAAVAVVVIGVAAVGARRRARAVSTAAGNEHAQPVPVTLPGRRPHR